MLRERIMQSLKAISLIMRHLQEELAVRGRGHQHRICRGRPASHAFLQMRHDGTLSVCHPLTMRALMLETRFRVKHQGSLRYAEWFSCVCS